MYENVCKLLLENGARLVYTGSKSVGNTLKKLEKEYPSFHPETSLNEKIAFEQALTGSYVAKRTACIFTTSGIYEALDPLMSSAYTGVIGGFLVVCIKETDVEVTPLGPFSKLPVMVVEDRDGLERVIPFAYALSEKYEIPVIVQVADESVKVRSLEFRVRRKEPEANIQNSKYKIQNSIFTKNPGRWAATPKFRFQLHKDLNSKIEKIREEFEKFEGNKRIVKGANGVITDRCSGMEFFDDNTSLLYLSTVYPLPGKLVDAFMKEMKEINVIEGKYPAIELQISDRQKIRKRDTEALIPFVNKKETLYGFTVIRDTLGPGSAINLAHGSCKLNQAGKILAITGEDQFFHSGMPAFVNTLYNNSSYLLLIMTNTKERQISKILKGFGFGNAHHIDDMAEIGRFKNVEELTVLFCKNRK
jgi:TPP-dependent indolepyruvate ferredoxin oxidoreductase alpha subunit